MSTRCSGNNCRRWSFGDSGLCRQCAEAPATHRAVTAPVVTGVPVAAATPVVQGTQVGHDLSRLQLTFSPGNNQPDVGPLTFANALITYAAGNLQFTGTVRLEDQEVPVALALNLLIETPEGYEQLLQAVRNRNAPVQKLSLTRDSAAGMITDATEMGFNYAGKNFSILSAGTNVDLVVDNGFKVMGSSQDLTPTNFVHAGLHFGASHEAPQLFLADGLLYKSCLMHRLPGSVELLCGTSDDVVFNDPESGLMRFEFGVFERIPLGSTVKPVDAIIQILNELSSEPFSMTASGWLFPGGHATPGHTNCVDSAARIAVALELKTYEQFRELVTSWVPRPLVERMERLRNAHRRSTGAAHPQQSPQVDLTEFVDPTQLQTYTGGQTSSAGWHRNV